MISYKLPQNGVSSNTTTCNFLCDRITPESLRWLIVKGKTKEATNLCSRIARVNGKNISMEEIKLEEIREERMGDIRDLFVSRKMAIKTVITWYCWWAEEIFKSQIIIISLLRTKLDQGEVMYPFKQ